MMSTYRIRFGVLKTGKKLQYRFVIVRGEQCACVVFIIWAQDGRGKYVRISGHTFLKHVKKKNTINRTNIIVWMSPRNAVVRRVWSRNRRRSLRTRGVAGDFGRAAVWGEGGRGTKRNVYRNLAANFFVRRWSSDIMRFFFLTRVLYTTYFLRPLVDIIVSPVHTNTP